MIIFVPSPQNWWSGSISSHMYLSHLHIATKIPLRTARHPRDPTAMLQWQMRELQAIQHTPADHGHGRSPHIIIVVIPLQRRSKIRMMARGIIGSTIAAAVQSSVFKAVLAAPRAWSVPVTVVIVHRSISVVVSTRSIRSTSMM